MGIPKIEPPEYSRNIIGLEGPGWVYRFRVIPEIFFEFPA